MNFNTHVIDYFAAKPEKAYAFLNPYVQCRYGRTAIRVSDVAGHEGTVEYIVMSTVYYPYPDGGCWEPERPCTDEEIEVIGMICSLYEMSEVPIDGTTTYRHLKLGSLIRNPLLVLLAA